LDKPKSYGFIDWWKNNLKIFILEKKLRKLSRKIFIDKYLWFLLIPVIIYYAIFCYAPMYGLIIAFKEFSPLKGIIGSTWIGFKWFRQFFDSMYFGRLFKNTLLINVYGLLWGFPIPIIFAILLNELKDGFFKKITQTISYLPHFISLVVICGIILDLFSSRGLINTLIQLIGKKSINFMSEANWFRTIYISTGIWQEFGWSSIIYIASISAIDPNLYEAARCDGANRFQQMLNITLPGLRNTITILLILNMGSILSVGFEKINLLYNPAIYETADVISTYVYRRGIQGTEFSFGAAVGLFNSVVNFFVLLTFQNLSKKFSEISLF